MFFRLVYDDMLAQAAYLIGCQRTGEAIVIDPERDVDRYLRLAQAEQLHIVAVAETHIHADFLSGARELAELTSARVHVSGEGGPGWQYGWLESRSGGGPYAHQVLRDGDVFHVGNIEFRAVHTPGHTPEHLCYLVTDRGSGADEPMGILTGDCVFVGDVGRPDLLETAAGVAGGTEEAARALHRSLGKFGALPEYLQVWPAHGAGSACGKALGAVPQSTVGYEKRRNPALLAAGATQAKFLEYILEGQPEPPLYFGRMKRQNRDGPAVLGDVAMPRRLKAGEIAGMDAGTIVLDARPWPQFKAGHLPGALHTPMGPNFIPVAGSYITDDKAELCLVAEPERVETALRGLVRIGLDGLRSFITPGELAAFRAGGGCLETAPEIDVGAMRERIAGGRGERGERGGRGPLVLDVRRAEEHRAGRVEGALNIAHTRLAGRLRELPKDRPILVHCQGGVRSAYATALLRREGFDATNIAGGFGAWEGAGFEVVR
ncbi:MAG: MBL fold metallo-hydrolase [Phycisphaerales bacterium]